MAMKLLELMRSDGPPWLRKAMLVLCILLIALQFGDGLSTHLAISTGRAEEQNGLLLSISQFLSWSIIETVFAAKILTGSIFGVAMLRTKPTPLLILILTVLTVYVGRIVATNFYLAWVLS